MKNLKKIIILVSILIIIFMLNFILSNTYFFPSQISFQIENLTKENIYNITIKADKKPCGLVNFSNTLKPTEKENITLKRNDFMKKCLSNKSDGSYGLQYKIGDKIYQTNFGYYTNGMPLDEIFDIKFLDTQKISVNGYEMKTDLADSFSMHRYFYAGQYKGDESLSTSNFLLGKTKIKNKTFYKDFPYVKTSRKAGKFKVIRKKAEEYGNFYIVTKNGKSIYKSTKTVFLVDYPFKNIVNKGDEWWMLYNQNQYTKIKGDLNITAKLIHNGKEIPVADAFALHNLNGKIFYFFKQKENSKIQYYLDGQVYQTSFDEIIHDRCCEPGVFNLRLAVDGRLAFWGIKDGKLSYNEAILPGFKMHQ
ncbi:hypothetical protein CSB11_00770 [Candidatus Campbellbacteria bacterium]|nr:MAG: hypothetical protein CSB11_00770 [Candidatus Campbellbacteria bacterium]